KTIRVHNPRYANNRQVIQFMVDHSTVGEKEMIRLIAEAARNGELGDIKEHEAGYIVEDYRESGWRDYNGMTLSGIQVSFVALDIPDPAKALGFVGTYSAEETAQFNTLYNAIAKMKKEKGENTYDVGDATRDSINIEKIAQTSSNAQIREAAQHVLVALKAEKQIAQNLAEIKDKKEEVKQTKGSDAEIKKQEAAKAQENKGGDIKQQRGIIKEELKAVEKPMEDLLKGYSVLFNGTRSLKKSEFLSAMDVAQLVVEGSQRNTGLDLMRRVMLKRSGLTAEHLASITAGEMLQSGDDGGLGQSKDLSSKAIEARRDPGKKPSAPSGFGPALPEVKNTRYTDNAQLVELVKKNDRVDGSLAKTIAAAAKDKNLGDITEGEADTIVREFQAAGLIDEKGQFIKKDEAKKTAPVTFANANNEILLDFISDIEHTGDLAQKVKEKAKKGELGTIQETDADNIVKQFQDAGVIDQKGFLTQTGMEHIAKVREERQNLRLAAMEKFDIKKPQPLQNFSEEQLQDYHKRIQKIIDKPANGDIKNKAQQLMKMVNAEILDRFTKRSQTESVKKYSVNQRQDYYRIIKEISQDSKSTLRMKRKAESLVKAFEAGEIAAYGSLDRSARMEHFLKAGGIEGETASSYGTLNAAGRQELLKQIMGAPVTGIRRTIGGGTSLGQANRAEVLADRAAAKAAMAAEKGPGPVVGGLEGDLTVDEQREVAAKYATVEAIGDTFRYDGVATVVVKDTPMFTTSSGKERSVVNVTANGQSEVWISRRMFDAVNETRNTALDARLTDKQVMEFLIRPMIAGAMAHEAREMKTGDHAKGNEALREFNETPKVPDIMGTVPVVPPVSTMPVAPSVGVLGMNETQTQPPAQAPPSVVTAADSFTRAGNLYARSAQFYQEAADQGDVDAASQAIQMRNQAMESYKKAAEFYVQAQQLTDSQAVFQQAIQEQKDIQADTQGQIKAEGQRRDDLARYLRTERSSLRAAEDQLSELAEETRTMEEKLKAWNDAGKAAVKTGDGMVASVLGYVDASGATEDAAQIRRQQELVKTLETAERDYATGKKFSKEWKKRDVRTDRAAA
ncbi:MAG TPA: hypothetical protein VLJ10_04570, partial [Candidatus Bathyarchaeia archaeon]|nr:hypothetical protein [Candidatus Bathyarchaeia archaeon]